MAYFSSPKILYGGSMLKRLGDELQCKGNKAAVISGRTVVNYCDPLVKALEDCGFIVSTWNETEPEPSFDIAAKGGQWLSELNPDLVVGFGGGSVLDTAKAAWILLERPDLDPMQLAKAVNPKTKLNLRGKAKFMAVPTTSGTGSEVNWAIVLSDKSTGKKFGFANKEIVPDVALLVPEFTAKMPKALTASTGLDVLGHALDGYTARQQNDFSDGLCLQAMALAFEWLPLAYTDGSNMQAREKMQNAAAIAGLGFGNSNTSLSHALAHAIGAILEISHGDAVGLSLPFSLEYISSNEPVPKVPDPRIKIESAAKYLGFHGGSSQDAPGELVKRLRALSKQISGPLSLKEVGISREQLDKKMEALVNFTLKDVNIYSCPCETSPESIKGLFEKMYEL